MMYIGLDPGASGGIALIHEDGMQSIKMPPTEKDIYKFLEHTPNKCFAYLEKVQGYTGQSQTSGKSMFNFGTNYGMLRMALVACEIPYELVVPRKWQAGLSIPPRAKSETKTQWKNRLKQKAQQLFPKSKITLNTCDAILIAEYCRRTHG